MNTTFRNGIFPDLDYATYRSIPAINISTLAWADESAAHLKAAIDGTMDKKESEDLAYGTALHARVLEPEFYYKRYVVSMPCSAILKSGDRKGLACGERGRYLVGEQWFCGKHASAGSNQASLTISEETARSIEMAFDRISAHPIVRLVNQRGAFECTICFTISDMGLHSCPLDAKVRLDKLILPTDRWPCTILDLKKVGHGAANQDDVENSIWRWKYDAKAAFYVDAVQRICGYNARFVWIFIEDSPPYTINVMEADRETIEIGRQRYQSWLGKYVVGKLSGEWPGHTDGTTIKRGGLPEHVRKKFRH